jgi:hypothetical protein
MLRIYQFLINFLLATVIFSTNLGAKLVPLKYKNAFTALDILITRIFAVSYSWHRRNFQLMYIYNLVILQIVLFYESLIMNCIYWI